MEGAEGKEIKVYDVMGREVAAGKLPTVTETALQGGVYMVKVGDAPARRVVVAR